MESNWLGDHVRLAFRLGEVNVGNSVGSQASGGKHPRPDISVYLNAT